MHNKHINETVHNKHINETVYVDGERRALPKLKKTIYSV